MRCPSNYNTKQREAVVEYIISQGNRNISAGQIVSHFQGGELSVGRTTVYRHLDKLTQLGKLRKYNIDGISGACYQYIDDEKDIEKHLLLKCDNCGELIRLDCNVINEIHEHIYQEHTFQVNSAKTVFYGTCESCFKSL